MRRKPMSYERKKKWIGFSFVIPWLIGCLTFFLRPFLETLRFSLCDVKMLDEGVSIKFSGLTNYINIFTKDTKFLPYFTQSLGETLYQAPVILLFSLFVALVLNQEFRGRTFFRAVFFLPVIVASGVIISIIRGDGYANTLMGSGSMFQAVNIQNLLLQTGINERLVNTMMSVVNNIFDLSWKSGVQILVFLAGLKTVSPALYEAAKIEGANSWEIFWKVTFPLLSPILIVNLVYTIVDTFSDYRNVVIKYIQDTMNLLQVSSASAMAWVYFLCVLLITVVVMALVSRVTFSHN